uniref:Uncharacterized protein n=1 Tax=Aegilops tauschii subsp. strangulata TaxID=200361 RepID=A0A453IXC0_AEGTS
MNTTASRQGWRRWAARREQPPTRCRDTSGGVARPSAAGSRAAAAVSRRGNPRLRPPAVVESFRKGPALGSYGNWTRQ